jgi:glutamate synthase domain-containing protein 1
MHGKITKQRALARVIVERALAGEYQFANMVMERIDGKATQQIDLAAMVRRIAEREGLDPDLVQAEAERILANL